MNDLYKMRLGVLKELKNVHRFIDNIERSVRANNPRAIERAYMLLCHLVREMDQGSMAPDSVALDVELMQAVHNQENKPGEYKDDD
jgi:FtsP/CotA-like multicopper oxidase with cupredoxin domain